MKFHHVCIFFVAAIHLGLWGGCLIGYVEKILYPPQPKHVLPSLPSCPQLPPPPSYPNNNVRFKTIADTKWSGDHPLCKGNDISHEELGVVKFQISEQNCERTKPFLTLRTSYKQMIDYDATITCSLNKDSEWVCESNQMDPGYDFHKVELKCLGATVDTCRFVATIGWSTLSWFSICMVGACSVLGFFISFAFITNGQFVVNEYDTYTWIVSLFVWLISVANWNQSLHFVHPAAIVILSLWGVLGLPIFTFIVLEVFSKSEMYHFFTITSSTSIKR